MSRLSPFQLTAARRRLAAYYDRPIEHIVSTHSRPKAAGGISALITGSGGRFNSQPPEGGWVDLRHDYPFNLGFNSQPPEGGWEEPSEKALSRDGFNSQPPEGGWGTNSA